MADALVGAWGAVESTEGFEACVVSGGGDGGVATCGAGRLCGRAREAKSGGDSIGTVVGGAC